MLSFLPFQKKGQVAFQMQQNSMSKSSKIFERITPGQRVYMNHGRGWSEALSKPFFKHVVNMLNQRSSIHDEMRRKDYSACGWDKATRNTAQKPQIEERNEFQEKRIFLL